MPARYHPLYDDIWNHWRLEGCSFEEKAFFVFLFGNTRERPSGIYRITDDQAAADTGLSIKRVTAYMADLERRHMIVRDGAWIFVLGYFKRQPKQAFLLRGAERDVKTCTSHRVLTRFSEKYPHYKQWSANGRLMVDPPMDEIRSTDADADADADAEQKKKEGANASRPASLAIAFKIPDSITTALDRCTHFAQSPKLRNPMFWQAMVRAYRGVDLAAELFKAEAWIVSNPSKAPRSNYPAFLRRWFARAAEARTA
jgi:hypothetical protein